MVGSFALGFIVRGIALPSKNPLVVPAINEDKTPERKVETPYLDLPLSYFSNNDISWGSMGNGDGSKITDYTEVSLTNKAVYQSYPTTAVTIKNYSNEIKPVKIRNFDEALADFYKVNPPGLWEDVIKKNYRDFGSLVTNYLPEDVIEKIDKFDADNDGQPETIVQYNFAGRADGGSYRSDIIKDNNIIFSVQEDRASIIPADTPDGFYVEWHNDKDTQGRCCPEGFTRSRFVFDNNKFVPVYEQDVRYLKVRREN